MFSVTLLPPPAAPMDPLEDESEYAHGDADGVTATTAPVLSDDSVVKVIGDVLPVKVTLPPGLRMNDVWVVVGKTSSSRL